jgi:carbon-monoxide dehydrogenase medium subunit
LIRNRFDYAAPTELHEALEWLGEAPDATAVVAGGTWTIVEMTRGRREPQRVLDLRRCRMNEIREETDEIAVGATATYTEVQRSPVITQSLPVLAEMAGGITGGPPIRNRGTIGGSACYANPASDVPAVLVGLNASLRLRSATTARELPAEEFFRGAFTTALEPGELLTEIVFPRPAVGTVSGYYKFKLCASSWPIATALCTVVDASPRRLALGGVSHRPIAVPLTGINVGEAAAAALETPWDYVLADGEYRRRITPVVARRAYERACEASG